MGEKGEASVRERERKLQVVMHVVDVVDTVGGWADVRVWKAPSAAVTWTMIYMWPSMAAVSISRAVWMGVGARRGSHREWSTATGLGLGGDDGRRASARRCSAIAPSEHSL
jgi:hypothetical protein